MRGKKLELIHDTTALNPLVLSQAETGSDNQKNPYVVCLELESGILDDPLEKLLFRKFRILNNRAINVHAELLQEHPGMRGFSCTADAQISPRVEKTGVEKEMRLRRL